jgi:DNA-binding protein Fis
MSVKDNFPPCRLGITRVTLRAQLRRYGLA